VIRTDSDRDELPPFAWREVGVVAAVAAVALAVSLNRYGFFGDELYFLAAGRRLSVGYADQGPVLPALARLADLIAPGALWVLQLPAALVTLGALLLSAQLAREFGGGRAAQVTATLAFATSPVLMLQGTVLATDTIDPALWVLIAWLVARWVRTRRDRLLWWAGVATAVDMQVKWLIPFWWMAVALGVLWYGPRDLLRRPALWAGAALTVVTMIPNLVWQSRHGWPQLRMGGEVAAEQGAIGRVTFVPTAAVYAGALGVVLLLCGVVALWRWEPLRPWRFLAPVLPVTMVAFVATDGRPYYLCGVYPVVSAAAAVWWTRAGTRRRTVVTGALAAISTLLVVSAMPWRPASWLSPAPSDSRAALALTTYGRFGWPRLRADVAAAYRGLSAADRSRAVVVAQTYWQASALDVARADYGLPPVYSADRGFGYFGVPPDTATTVVWVGGDRADLLARYADVRAIGRVDAKSGMRGATRDVTIWRCASPRLPWSTAWPGMQSLHAGND
jgi:hypothetical protein